MASAKTITMVRGERTTLTKANDKSYSLRTTVPKGISNQLDLKEGDSIIWKLVPSGDDFMIVVVPSNEKNHKKK